MKRILKLLARLYPVEWRKRYGAEYETLLEDAAPRAWDIFDVLWGALEMQLTSRNFVRIVLPCSLAGIFAAILFSLAVPPHYSSEKILPVITTNTSANALEANGVQSAFNQEFLASVIAERNLYSQERGSMHANEVIEMMRRSIHFHVIPPTSPNELRGFEGLLFLPVQHGTLQPVQVAVQFDYTDPHVAQQVDLDLVNELLFGTPSHGFAWIGGANPVLHSRDTFIAYQRSGASLPNKPNGPGRIELSIIGLLAGLLGGMITAAILGSHPSATSR